MKNLFKFLLVLAIVPMLTMMSCKEEATETEYEILTTYMAQNNLDLPDVLDGWVTSGGGLTVDANDFSVADYYIFDIRSADAYATGHIKDAVNVPLSGLLDAAEAAGKTNKYLIVCYSGQTAARATGLLKMLGYTAKSLKWGMSGWHEDFSGSWENNHGDFASTNWLTSGTPPAVKEFDNPSFATGEVDGEAILKARVQAVLSADWAVNKTDVLDNPGNYFINNKWSLTSWDNFGHINGAYRIDEDLNLDGLVNLDPSQTVVTYCYTGQTSSITTAWLDVLGFDGRSLLFGANGIVHSSMVGTSVAGKCWKGAGSGSTMNFGYYDGDGSMHDPK
jgi:rhodanese-related sulfurtransferase